MLQFLNETTGDLKNAVFCFTGKSPKTRAEMLVIATNANAGVTAGITNRTTILVVADPGSTSNKVQKAQYLGLEMISPNQFFAMCKHVTESNGGNPISQVHIAQPKEKDQVTGKRKHSSVRHIQL